MISKLIKNFILLNKSLSFKISKFLDKKFGSNKCELDYFEYINKLQIDSLTVLELGGTKRPIFNKEDVKYYIGLDIDSDFHWEKYYHLYLNQSCTSPFENNVDFVCSKYLLEHVDDNTRTYKNIIESLRENGTSIHLFPLGFHPYSLITRIIGNNFQKKLIKILRPEAESVTGYPVYYNLCDSISLEKFLRKQSKIDYQVKYYYGASEYFYSIFPAYLLVEISNRISKALGLTIFASNAVVLITKKYV